PVVFTLVSSARSSTLFPYTTLFRSWSPLDPPWDYLSLDRASASLRSMSKILVRPVISKIRRMRMLSQISRRSPSRSRARLRQHRSEEHTSELQSPDHLVCRLLLEKK